MSRKLFGTDGIRGVAGQFPLDPRTVHAFGVALGEWAAGAEVLIGIDTRESGPWIAAQVAGGLQRAGVKARFAGLITTPGVAHLTRTGQFVAGLMISASHNPYQDNGLKVFDYSGYKLPDGEERRLEERIFELLEDGIEPREAALAIDEGLDRQYLAYLESAGASRLDRIRIVIDCANGAAAHLAPALFERLGAEVYSIGTLPNGRNINLNCGALHVDALRREVVNRGAALGVAFDGDADRAIFVTSTGKVVDGDGVMLVAGRDLQAAGRLRGDLVVATVMSNLGLEIALRDLGIRMVRTAVGDRYVIEEMVRQDATLGGEQSGHVIFRDCSTTGDGLLTAVRILNIMMAAGQSLDELTAALRPCPQVLTNIRVASRRPLQDLPSVQNAIRAAQEDLGGEGRVLVRFSGTEPLVRVMVEGLDENKVRRWEQRIAAAVRAELCT
jgi:phosphoglucosamine mutase